MQRAAAESGSSGYGTPDNSEAALRTHKVDLWPLITITPERQKVIHITKPYLQHDYSLAVLAGSAYSRFRTWRRPALATRQCRSSGSA